MFLNILRQIKKVLINGFYLGIGKYEIHIFLKYKLNIAEKLLAEANLRQVEYLKSKFQFLNGFEFETSTETAEEILNFYYYIIPMLNKDSFEVNIRNALEHLQGQTKNHKLYLQTITEIAKSDLRNNIPDRAKILGSTYLSEPLQEALIASDLAYGARLLTSSWQNQSRGDALVLYFQNNTHFLQDKKILHFSPEPELKNWIIANQQKLNITYVTSNIIGNDCDTKQDLTALTLEADFDVIICHRVLEHILDDKKAMTELFRILKHGGILNVSIPQSMHIKDTSEWVVPDKTHDYHVRQYGADFVFRLQDAGFVVNVENWLLDKTEEYLLLNNVYPLRMYIGIKPMQ